MDGVNRRDFFQAGTAAALAAGIGAGSSSCQRTDVAGPEVAAASYEAQVPDTLDLAQRAALALRALSQTADARFNYETCLGGHLDHQPAYMSWRLTGPCMQKPIHALPMLRTMTGSTFNEDMEQKMLEAVAATIEGDGLWWYNIEGSPWREAYQMDQVWPNSQARLIVTLLDRHKYDGNARWLDLAERLAEGLARIALRDEDRAWFFTTFTRPEGWRMDVRPHSGTVRERTLSEPPGVSFYDVGLPLRAFSRGYAVSGDEKALDMAHRLARFMLKPTMWAPSEGPSMVTGHEHGHWGDDHFHSHTMAVMGLLEYATITNHKRLQRFVADFYEYSRNFGISRIGFFPAVIGPVEQIQNSNLKNFKGKGQVSEGCATADMTWLATALSEAGVGDYWEDVDQYVRNQLVEFQLLRRDLLEQTIAAGPRHEIDPLAETDEDVLERSIGSFASGGDPTILYAWWTMCCTTNIPVSLYKVWKAIVRETDGVAQVNLLLNRASPGLDVDSYLPYEGKVVLRNKTARKVHLRIPHWADKKAVRCQVNDREISPCWLNNNLSIESLGKDDVITVEFPMVETTEKDTEASYAREYTCRFKGNTLMDISPRAERPEWKQSTSDDGSQLEVGRGYPIYLRDHFKETRAPLKKVQRYVSPSII